ncbi:MAG: cystathionine beta-lyase [Holophaga sp.]|nr:cystathionine beta-lyase [Holophaga sp.]
MIPSKSLQTSLVHGGYSAPEGYKACPAPILRASTVLFESVADLRTRGSKWLDKSTYLYGLFGTPTSYELEARLAEIEGGDHCLLTPSGLSAIAMVDMGLLGQGDDVLIPDNVYSPARELGDWLQEKFGITARTYDPMATAAFKDQLRPNTRLVWTEAPGSVSMEVPDLPMIAAAAHGQGALVALDNTWSAGLAYRGFEHGADIVLQALTKYQSGGSDLLMGAVITRDPDLHRRIGLAHLHLGYGVGMEDAYLILRSLPTLKLRFEAHDAGARTVAAWLQQRPEIARVLHPAFPDCPGHEIWKRDFTGASGLFSVLFDPSYPEAGTDRFVDALRLFKLGFSWGGATSLCLPYRIQGMRSGWDHPGQLVRFNIGLEDPADLIADIEQALAFLN